MTVWCRGPQSRPHVFFQQRLGIFFDIVHPFLDDRTALGLYRPPVDGQARKPRGLDLHGLFYALRRNGAIVCGIIERRERFGFARFVVSGAARSEEHTSELQSLMRISYAVFCLKKKI